MQNIRKKPSVFAAETSFSGGDNGGFRHRTLQAGQAFFCLIVLLFSAVAGFAQTDEFQPKSDPGAGKILVHSKFGGQIFGFDIDQNGSEGILSEAGGSVNAAVETFDQKTGKILKVVIKTETQDDFITMGVVGNSVGLVEREHVEGGFVVKRTFKTLDPLNSNTFTGLWTPPIGSKHIIMPGGVSRSQGVKNVAVFAYDNSDNFIPYVFSSNVAANTFGPVVKIKDSLNFASVPPPIAYDSETNQAVLGGGDGCFDCFPVIGVVDLTKGTFKEFTGIGFGFVNGIAIDAADGIAVTDTEDDATVEFYDLKKQTGFTVVLPNSGGQQQFSGADVEFDPIHKLFLIAQPLSSSASSGSTIYVYDTEGNLKETLNGFNFNNTFNVVAAHIALNPSKRSGFVDGPDQGVTEIQSFTY
jgi:WD40 repeat protein